MNAYKMITGTLFILTGAIFLSAQYISSAILSTSHTFWSNTAPLHDLGNAGYILLTLSIASFLIGALFIASAAGNRFEH
ncbi:hypothetical protein [Sediminibacillus halophilus]|uniref:Uncharacterized protein n=1 Tax=Sediminibacillus halophilus TaxID=482461 RepID=A0A1G9R8I8_9BACI|nr:hypothetical protein [Sediminibacillus halophilus]SDM19451.1 hypothetical protein SAMN05216244_1870 [Sediminibacillus halophilus]